MTDGRPWKTLNPEAARGSASGLGLGLGLGLSRPGPGPASLRGGGSSLDSLAAVGPEPTGIFYWSQTWASLWPGKDREASAQAQDAADHPLAALEHRLKGAVRTPRLPKMAYGRQELML